MRELEGVWSCESGTVNGRKLDEKTTRSLKLTLKGEQFKTERDDEVLFDSKYSIDTEADPKQIDMVGIGELEGKVGQGIYELKKDRLTICYTMPGKERPKEFSSKEGSDAHLIVWRRTTSDGK